MTALDCPFRTGKEEIKKLRESTDIIIVDFHAEATSEKIAFGYFVDGEVSAVIGTHTHVQTADERYFLTAPHILRMSETDRAYGFCYRIEKEQIIERFLLQMPMKFEVAKGEGILSPVVIEIDEKTGKATAIQRLQLKYPLTFGPPPYKLKAHKANNEKYCH